MANNIQADRAAKGSRGSNLLKAVLEFQQKKWLRPEDFTGLIAKLGIHGIEHEINFLREFKELVRSIPLKAYVDPEQRQRFLEAIQLALDDAIDREEEDDDFE